MLLLAVDTALADPLTDIAGSPTTTTTQGQAQIETWEGDFDPLAILRALAGADDPRPRLDAATVMYTRDDGWLRIEREVDRTGGRLTEELVTQGAPTWVGLGVPSRARIDWKSLRSGGVPFADLRAALEADGFAVTGPADLPRSPGPPVYGQPPVVGRQWLARRGAVAVEIIEDGGTWRARRVGPNPLWYEAGDDAAYTFDWSTVPRDHYPGSSDRIAVQGCDDVAVGRKRIDRLLTSHGWTRSMPEGWYERPDWVAWVVPVPGRLSACTFDVWAMVPGDDWMRPLSGLVPDADPRVRFVTPDTVAFPAAREAEVRAAIARATAAELTVKVEGEVLVVRARIDASPWLAGWGLGSAGPVWASPDAELPRSAPYPVGRMPPEPAPGAVVLADFALVDPAPDRRVVTRIGASQIVRVSAPMPGPPAPEGWVPWPSPLRDRDDTFVWECLLPDCDPTGKLAGAAAAPLAWTAHGQHRWLFRTDDGAALFLAAQPEGPLVLGSRLANVPAARGPLASVDPLVTMNGEPVAFDLGFSASIAIADAVPADATLRLEGEGWALVGGPGGSWLWQVREGSGIRIQPVRELAELGLGPFTTPADPATGTWVLQATVLQDPVQILVVIGDERPVLKAIGARLEGAGYEGGWGTWQKGKSSFGLDSQDCGQVPDLPPELPITCVVVAPRERH